MCGVCDVRVTRASYETDESDDGAQAADVVARKEERLMYGVVFGDTEDAVVVFVALLDTLDEDALARFEDIDGAPLEETDVGDFVAGEEIATIIERHHGVARDPDEEVCALIGKFRYDIAFPVAHAHATTAIGREASYCIERYEWNALIATFGNLVGYLDAVFCCYWLGHRCCLKH